jgi:hypothetical protein
LTTRPEVVGVLRVTRRLLIERGWSPTGVGQGKLCLDMALRTAAAEVAGDPRDFEAIGALLDPTRAALGFEDCYDIFLWNDVPGRTVEDVMLRLERGTAEAAWEDAGSRAAAA